MPDDYYVSQYSGEEIDAAVGRAATGGALDKRIATFVNPNLLDNWYFANPVNQRGKTEYVFSSDSPNYCIDRWRAYSGGSGKTFRLKPIDNHVEISLDVPYGRFDQLVENYSDLIGKQATFTVLFEDIVSNEILLVANQRDAQKNASCYGKKLASVTFTMPPTAGRLYCGIQNNDSVPVTVKPIAAKLELGSQQTLAHQDSSGNWVLNEVPNYADTLRACQRYYVNMVSGINQYTPIGIGVARSATEIQGKVSVPVQMRALPTISTDAAYWLIVNGGNYLTPTGITVNGMSPVLINITISGQGFSTGAAYELFVNPGAKISVSAEL